MSTESESENGMQKMDSFHICLGFITDTVSTSQIGYGKNAFGDLECGYAVRCWDKRLVHNGIIHSKYTLQSSKHSNTNIINSDNIERVLNRRLHECMRVNDKLTFLVDMSEEKRCIEILLNDEEQSHSNELKFELDSNINQITFCTSLWTVGINVRILEWTLIDRKTE